MFVQSSLLNWVLAAPCPYSSSFSVQPRSFFNNFLTRGASIQSHNARNGANLLFEQRAKKKKKKTQAGGESLTSAAGLVVSCKCSFWCVLRVLARF